MAMHNIIRAALFTPIKGGWGLPLAFEAGPGVGKSDILEEITESLNLHIEVLSPGERGAGQFGVVPMPKQLPEGHPLFDLLGGVVLSYPAPEWVIPFFEKGRGVVLVDELTTATPAIQPALLGLFLRKVIGTTHFPGGVRFMAAYNAPEDAAAGYDLPKPAANRMGHLKFDSGDVEAWTDWVLSEDTMGEHEASTFDPAAEEARVLAIWPDAFAFAKGIVTSFMRKRPGLIHVEPKAEDPQASKGWPSRRSWAYVIRSIACAIVHELDEEDRDLLIAAFVGQAAASELLTYLRDADLPDPVAILDRTTTFTHSARRLDRTYAVLSACTALVMSPKCDNQKARLEAMWELLSHVVDNGGKDIAFGSVRRLAEARLLGAGETRSVLRKLNDVLEAADMRGN